MFSSSKLSGPILAKKSYGKFWVSTTYTSDITVGDHIKFDSIHSLNDGNSITLDTTTSYVNTTNTPSIGRFTLLGGKKYNLKALISAGNAASIFTLRWYNSDLGTEITDSIESTNQSPDSSTSDSAQPIANTYFSPSVDTRVELRITAINSIASIKGKNNNYTSWAEIEVIENLVAIKDSNEQIFEISHSLSSGNTPGNASTGSWTKKTINSTFDRNDNTIASISSSVITLQAGTYEILDGWLAGFVTDRIKARLRNTSDSITVSVGSNGFSTGSSSTAITYSLLRKTKFTITSAKNFELQYYAQSTGGGNTDFGTANSTGEDEVYAYLKIKKVS